MKFIVRLSLIIVFLSNSIIVNAAEVSPQRAALIAKHFLAERTDTPIEQIQCDYVSLENGFYLCQMIPDAWVMVASDDAAIPVIAYSTKGRFDFSVENQPPAFRNWMNNISAQMMEIKFRSLQADPSTASEWERLEKGILQTSKDLRNVNPLLLSEWNQDTWYNEQCPTDNMGPGGFVYAGCVATAMAQIMYYYRYPDIGTGSNSYSTSYGTLAANFGSTTYHWDQMLTEINSTNPAIAQLIYHCGIAVEMDYSPSGSSADIGNGLFGSPNAADALQDHFDYSSSITFYTRAFTSNWAGKLRTEIDNGRPVLYRGAESTFSGGHAFVCDGYQSGDYFHFNWGWSGSYDGFFQVDNLNPGTSDFNSGQQAVMGIEPETSSYPSFCSGSHTLTSFKGTFEDGSGHQDYQSGSNCSWLIQPAGADHINLEFLMLETESSQDEIKIYDGANISATLLGTYSGSTLPSQVQSSGPELFVTFTSDASNNAQGFFIEYEAVYPVFCSGTVNLTQLSDSFTDGSGANNYNDNSNCKWLIQPAGAGSITIDFTQFDMGDALDYVRLIDPNTTPATTLATFSQSYPPVQTVHYGSSMLVMFKTNGNSTGQGWSANYTSSQVGIDENGLSSVNLYPNPAQDKVIISNYSGAFALFDATGRMLIQNEVSMDRWVNTSTLKAGIYFIRLLDDAEVRTLSFQKL